MDVLQLARSVADRIELSRSSLSGCRHTYHQEQKTAAESTVGAGTGLGNVQFALNLRNAYNGGRSIRVVDAAPDSVVRFEVGGEAFAAGNPIEARPDRVGHLEASDGDHFTIGFDWT